MGTPPAPENQDPPPGVNEAVAAGSPLVASPWAPFSEGFFRALWVAQLVSNIGTWMQNVGAVWLMGSLGGSAF
ncbi:MAG: MFS transporter, partial [Acidimicrobiia bacterium]